MFFTCVLLPVRLTHKRFVRARVLSCLSEHAAGKALFGRGSSAKCTHTHTLIPRLIRYAIALLCIPKLFQRLQTRVLISLADELRTASHTQLLMVFMIIKWDEI